MKKVDQIIDGGSTIGATGFAVLDWRKDTVESVYVSQDYATDECLRLLNEDDSRILMTAKITRVFHVKKQIEYAIVIDETCIRDVSDE
jgi:hypothetical protein